MNTSKRVMIIVGLVIVVLCVVFTIFALGRGEEDGEWTGFEPLDSQLAVVDMSYAKWFKDRIDVMSIPAGQRVVCDWLMYKSYAVTQHTNMGDALEKFIGNDMDFAVDQGVRADYWASVAAWEEFLKAYQDENARKKLFEICKDEAPDLETQFNNEIISFKQFATNEELLDEAGHLKPDKAKLALLLHRYVWIKASQQQFPVNAIQTPEEAMAMFRWQVEASHMAADKKIEKLHETKTSHPGAYDYTYAEAVIDIQNGDYAAACLLLSPIATGDGMVDPYQQNLYRRAMKAIKALDANACP